MKIHDVEQGTLDWFNLRLGKPTASEFKKILTPLFSTRSGEGFDTYVYEKAGEAYCKHAQPGGGSWATEQGQIVEGEARAWYEMEHDCDLRQVGFIEAADGLSGCSPDALCGEAFGLEIKCPQMANHVRYLVEGKLPSDYATQVHGSLYVTGLKEWRFLSYHRGFPPFLLTVKRDEAIMSKIANALATFHAAFKDALETITSHSKKH